MDKKTTFENGHVQLDTITPDEFHRTYRNYMAAVAAGEGLDHQQVDEVIDNVMITIFVRKKCTYKADRGPFMPYLRVMVRNEARSLLRKERHYQCYEEKDMERLCDESGMCCQMKTGVRELGDEIQEGLRRLRAEMRSPLQFDAFAMMVIGGGRPKEIAERLGVRPDYVSLAKLRCLPRFRAILREIEEKG